METMKLRCTLTREEVEERADALARLHAERDALEMRRKDFAQEMKADLGHLSARIAMLAEQVRDRAEWRDVEVFDQRNDDRKTMDIVRNDTGEVVGSRALLPHERQVELFEVSRGGADSQF